MALSEVLANPPARVRKGRSIMDEWLDTLPTHDQAAVITAVINPAWAHVDLMRVLQDEGAPEVADTTFGTWRRKHGYTA